MFNFKTKNTTVSWALKTSGFPIFKFAGILKQIFLYLFFASLFFVFFCLVFLEFDFILASFKISASFLALYLLFLNLSLFLKFKIEKPEIKGGLSKAVLNPEAFNMAEFLSLDACEITEDAIKFCQKRKIKITLTALFYSTVKLNKDIKLICYRLGLDVLKLQEDLKNYLEKMQRQVESSEQFSEDFQNAIIEAAKLSAERNHKTIGAKEILVGLAKHDEFFKKVLVDSDLKEKDIENITLWLDSVEESLEQAGKFWTYENLSKYGSAGKDWASGFTVTLDQFSIDWRNIISKWIFREVVGHKREIEETERILGRSEMTNVLIVGEPGTGRKSIIQALAQRCYLGTGLAELKNKRVVELDMVALLSQIQDFEKLEITLDQIFGEVLASGNVILVIDELHNFVSQPLQKPGATDISGILSKYMPIKNFQFVGITSFEGLHNNIEKNSSFAGLFSKVEVSEISEPETIIILQNSALELEQKHKILITYPAIREIVNLTGRYFPSLLFPKKALDVLDETAVYVANLKEKRIMPSHVAKIVSDRTEIPIGKMEFKEKEVLLNLENLIHQRIINQQEAVKEISIAMRRARSGIASKKRPMGSFIFLGPTGVGKTETSKALAEIYFSGEDKMIRIDMSEFQAVSDIPRLIGAVSPVEMQGLLTTPVRETPFSLVLLDEIEKAHPNILNLFLQVLDEGHITDGHGRKVIFTNTIIICTSNAGAEKIFESVQAGEKINKQELLDFLFKEKIFRPEFINRFDAAVIFNPLSKENLIDIAQLMLGGLKKNLEEKEIEFVISEPLKEKIAELSYKPEFGAREMRRTIQDKIENVVAEALLSDKIKKGDKIELNPETFEILVNTSASS